MAFDDDRAEPFLTVAEVAELLKLNQQTVRNWIEQGSLPAIRVGRRVRIRREDLERILAAGYQAGSVPPAREPEPSAEDFWGGGQVGVAELDPAAPAGSPDAADDAADSDDLAATIHHATATHR